MEHDNKIFIICMILFITFFAGMVSGRYITESNLTYDFQSRMTVMQPAIAQQEMLGLLAENNPRCGCQED